MNYRLIAPLALFLVAACGTDLTPAGGPDASIEEPGVTDKMESHGKDAREQHRHFRRPAYPRRDG